MFLSISKKLGDLTFGITLVLFSAFLHVAWFPGEVICLHSFLICLVPLSLYEPTTLQQYGPS